MLIGVDFDNTIVRYDELFHRVAVEENLIPASVPVSKEKVRDYLRSLGKEEDWTKMQGLVYGARMQEAAAFPGVLEFFARCVKQQVPVCIVSHKTRYPYLGHPWDLHAAARGWLESQGFFDAERIGLSPDRVYFELTKQEKLARIGKNGCTQFIDDLPEFLTEANFPAGVDRILFDPQNHHLSGHPLSRAASWAEIEQLISC
ncbi:MAG: hypothetical protein JGK17_09395 [Microcoleus sp. PH2017_10_PVI_O_A]|uniref:hypothetical protein n=1 Tax=unclassified Microcoleus TaxID=2642155 RepID=UPI001DAB91BD|nr:MULTISPECIES: hypothetical protein [unclassified Microcoleus]TAE80564.1 MAG: haloacid dehalogenase-like hydrolase [Oscillatoriales cyanobacterium]MCC3405791.1 hypothetical protein [Microcoleus sp. PH2017_10_PVI_O_A]MCC3459904.1 hypothetical protein [Microcoleus sp. PH2017_11_PCY_U_A]MCC3478296.1 hypothetical protein [Microcoleus sp. PH2017_12_PCY_D_A]MCC3559271.1 hypothetical protein [Microcoleus sp. PH2017_27_LUM_O_A]